MYMKRNGIVSQALDRHFMDTVNQSARLQVQDGNSGNGNKWRGVMLHDMTQWRLSVVDPHESGMESTARKTIREHRGSRPDAQTERRKRNCEGITRCMS